MTNKEAEQLKKVLDGLNELSIGHISGHFYLRLLLDQRWKMLAALRCLYDEQNGPPLLQKRHKEAWEKAMAATEAILNEVDQ